MTKSTIRLAVIISIVVGIAIAVSFYVMQHPQIKVQLATYFEPTLSGSLYFTIALSLTMAVGLPRQIAAFSAGYLLGTMLGTFIATLAASIGCLLTVTFAKAFFARYVRDAYPKQQQALTQFFAKDILLKAIIIRFIPAGSNFLTNILAGSVNVPIGKYLLGTTIGFIPQMTLFSMLGNGIRVSNSTQITLSVVLLIVASLLGYWVYKRANKKGS